MSKKEILFS